MKRCNTYAKLVVALVLLATSVPTGASPPPNLTLKPTQWALIVGVGQYEHKEIDPVNFAVEDANSVGYTLINECGFPAANVIQLTSDVPHGDRRPTNVEVLRQIAILSRKVKPNDTFVFYFAGHGFIREDGQHFLSTVNADPSTKATLQLSSLPVDVLAQEMKKIQAGRTIFIADACRNEPDGGRGAEANKLTPSFARSLRVIAENSSVESSAVLLACSEGERAWEFPKAEHGVFTYFLLEGLKGKAKDKDGLVSLPQLAEFVKEGVRQWSVESGRAQTPDLRLSGEAFRFGKAPGAMPAAPAAEKAEPFAPSNPQQSFQVSLDVDRPDRRYELGENLEIRFQVKQECFVTIFDRDPAGRYVRLFPNEAAKDNRCTPGKTYTIGAPNDDFELPIQEPVGTETIVLIATLDDRPVLDPGQLLAGEGPVREVKEEGAKGVGVRLKKKNPALWATTSVAIETVRKR